MSASHAATFPASHGLPASARLTMCRTGLRLFLLSEAMIFVLLLVVRFVLAGRGHPGELNQPLAVAMTGFLLLSGWPARRAVTAAARDDGRRLLAAVGWTVALGTLFLGAMAFEWAELAVSSRSLYGTVFFTTTGLHGLHVLVGLLIWLAIASQARAGLVAAGRNWGVEAAELYWRFVDVVWIFIYPVFYLL